MKKIITLFFFLSYSLIGNAQYMFFELELFSFEYREITENCDDCAGGPDPNITVLCQLKSASDELLSEQTFNYVGNDESCFPAGPNFLIPPGVQRMLGLPGEDNWRIEVYVDGFEDDGGDCGGNDGICGGFSTDPELVIYPQNFNNCEDHYLEASRICEEYEYGANFRFIYWYRGVLPGEVALTKTTYENRNELINNLSLETTTADPATPGSTYDWQMLDDDDWVSTGITTEDAPLIQYLLENTTALGAYTFRRMAINDQTNNCTETRTATSNHLTIFINDDCDQIYLSEDFEAGSIPSPPFANGGTLANLWTVTPTGANLSQYAVETGYAPQPTAEVVNFLETSVTIPSSQRSAALKFDMTYILSGSFRLLIDDVVVEEFTGVDLNWRTYTYELSPGATYDIRWEYRKQTTDAQNDFEAVRLDNIRIYDYHPDYKPLLSLFYGTDGAVNWTEQDGWEDRMININCDPCTWAGVTCNGAGRVIALELPNNNISGPLAKDMRGLTELQTLNLSANQIDGTLEAWLADLQALEILNLSGNLLNGSLEAWLANLSSLEILDLSDNGLGGSLGGWIGGFPNLQLLNLAENGLSGPLPPELEDLSGLQQLLLHDNQLGECLPSTLTDLTNLTVLQLQNNLLEGYFPIVYQAAFCPAVNPGLSADFSNNPGLPAAGDLTAFCNDGSGSEVERTVLDQFYLATDGAGWTNNSGWLTNCNPCEWYGITCNTNNQITHIELPANNLSGEIPAVLSTLAHLEILDLNGNQLSGIIPPELAALSGSITQINFRNNELEGCFAPALAALCSPAITVDFSGNDDLFENGDFDLFCIDGSGGCCSLDPTEPPVNDNCATAMDLPVGISVAACNWNATDSGVPGAGQGCGNPQAEMWFRFTTPDCPGTGDFAIGLDHSDFDLTRIELFSGTCGNLTSVACDGSQGPNYPQEVLNVSGLALNTTYYLRVWNTATEGAVTIYLQDLNPSLCICEHPDHDALEALYNTTGGNSWTNNNGWLADCDPCGKYDGTPWFGVTCDANNRVQSLVLPANNLTGSLPEGLDAMDALTDLDLSQNNLTGTIPASLGNLPQLDRIELQNNQLEGCFSIALLALCEASVQDFSNNPGLPGGGDFAAFCTDETGACDGENCPDDLVLTDDPVEDEVFRASGSITSDVSITGELAIEYLAGESILLQPGFSVLGEATFSGRIEDCPPAALAGQIVPGQYALEVSSPEPEVQIYPNPFSAFTTIAYHLPEATQVRFTITDISGRLIQELESLQWQEAGHYRLEWSPDGHRAGIYLLQAAMNGQLITRKLVLVHRF